MKRQAPAYTAGAFFCQAYVHMCTCATLRAGGAPKRRLGACPAACVRQQRQTERARLSSHSLEATLLSGPDPRKNDPLLTCDDGPDRELVIVPDMNMEDWVGRLRSRHET